MKKPTEIIEKYVNNNYGDLITFNGPLYYRDSKTWVAELKSDYPRFIHDDKDPKTTIVKYITFRELGEVKLTNANEIEATPRDELVSRLDELLIQWRETVEEVILKGSSYKLAHIGTLKDSLNPVIVAVDYFSKKDTEILTFEEIRKDARSGIMLRWLRFLSQIHITEEVDDGFRYGPKLAELQKQLSDTRMRGDKTASLTTTVISYIMREYYNTVRQMLGVSRFDPYLHMATCYYLPCVQAGRLLHRREESLIALYHKWYPRFPNYRLSAILGQLQDVSLLRREGDYWYGSEDTWDRMDPLKKKIPQELAPMKA